MLLSVKFTGSYDEVSKLQSRHPGKFWLLQQELVAALAQNLSREDTSLDVDEWARAVHAVDV